MRTGYGQLFGGRATLSSSANGAFTTRLFEGNPAERLGMTDPGDGGVDFASVSECSLKLDLSLIPPTTSNTGVWLAQARLTWASGRGQGTSTAIVDIGPSGAQIVLPATTYLKVEIGIFATVPALGQWTVELGMVRHYGAISPLPTFTARATALAGASSVAQQVPAYAYTATILPNDPVPVFVRDALNFLPDPVAATASVLVRPAVDWAAVPNGATFWTVTNNSLVPLDYYVCFRLRLA